MSALDLDPPSLEVAQQILKGLKTRLDEQAEELTLMAATLRANQLYVARALEAVTAALEARDE